MSCSARLLQNAPQISIPRPDNEPEQVSPKIENLVNEISKLTLIEVSELSSVLKKKLNIPDAPVMSFGGFAPPAAAPTEVGVYFFRIEKIKLRLSCIRFLIS